MNKVDISIIAQRFISLRRHLGERTNTRLTVQDVADQAGIAHQKMGRLEHGKGGWESLIQLLLFYRSQGYNIDWILVPDNATIPMMLPSGGNLLVISEMIQKLSQQLAHDHTKISNELRKLGYIPLEDKPLSSASMDLDAGTPEVFDFS